MVQATGKNKKQKKPREGAAWLLVLALFLLFGAFIMSIFSSFATPFMKWVNWFKLNLGGQKVGFSVWGFCADKPRGWVVLLFRLFVIDSLCTGHSNQLFVTTCPKVRPGWSFLDL